MDQPPKVKPKAWDYISEHWDQFKDKSILVVKKELKDMCDLGSEADIKSLGIKFNNEKARLKKAS